MHSLDINRKNHEYILEFIENNCSGEEDGFGVQIFFPSKFQYSRMIRISLGFLFQKFHISSKQVKHLILAADELMSNAIDYGSQPQDINTFEISIGNNGGNIEVSIQVSDRGTGEFSRNAKQMWSLIEENKKTWNDDLARQRGRGFQIITKIADSYDIQDNSDGGLTVSLMKRVSKEDN